jgi:hypothetical protein
MELKASAPRPYTVSVGKAMTPPFLRMLTPCSISLCKMTILGVSIACCLPESDALFFAHFRV